MTGPTRAVPRGGRIFQGPLQHKIRPGAGQTAAAIVLAVKRHPQCRLYEPSTCTRPPLSTVDCW
jgi:hypothetical protein